MSLESSLSPHGVGFFFKKNSVSDNNISAEGAKALADMLRTNNTVTYLE